MSFFDKIEDVTIVDMFEQCNAPNYAAKQESLAKQTSW